MNHLANDFTYKLKRIIHWLILPLIVVSIQLVATATNSQIAGLYLGEISVESPAPLGALSVSIHVASIGEEIHGVVDGKYSAMSNQSTFLSGLIDSTSITPTFEIASAPVQTTVDEREIERSLIMVGEILQDGEILQGTYTETVKGFVDQPLVSHGPFMLTRSSQTVLVPTGGQTHLPTGGGQTSVTFTLLDGNGDPIPNKAIQFSAELGTVEPADNTTDANGNVIVTFTTEETPGMGSLTASCCEGIIQTLPIHIETPIVEALDLSIEETSVRSNNGSVDITATVADQFGQPVSGELINFYHSQGTVAPLSGISDTNGRVEAVFTPNNPDDEATITVLSSSLAASRETSDLTVLGVAGDCNDDEGINAGDISAVVLEIFDNDGSFWLDTRGGTFSGNSAGCDANTDTSVNAGDISCTVLLIFNGTGACHGGQRSAASSQLTLDQNVPANSGETVTMGLSYTSQGNAVNSATFSLDIDETLNTFDATDSNEDGVPDSVQMMVPSSFNVSVTYDSADLDGEIDIYIADTFLPFSTLPDGVLLTLDLGVRADATSGEAVIQFSQNPTASLGSTSGQTVPVETGNGSIQITGSSPTSVDLSRIGTDMPATLLLIMLLLTLISGLGLYWRRR